MNKGTSQKSRKNIALEAEYISIDERSILDLVRYTLDFSRYLNFYNLHNKVIDNWTSFLLNDSAFIIAMIATTDIDKFKINYNDYDFQLNEKAKEERIQQLTQEIYNVILNWSELLKKANFEGSLLSEIEKLINSFKAKHSTSEENNITDTLKETYENIFGNLVFVKEKAVTSYEAEIFNSVHHPHIGLLLAFFKLYQILQNDLNTITQKHLDYYFLELLQQKKKKVKSQSAIIAIEFQQEAKTLEITEEDKINLVFEGNQQLVFRPSSNCQINKAEIAEIKTLFKSDYNPFGYQFEEDDFSINIFYESEIYPNENKGINPELMEFGEFPATLGEEISHHLFSESNVRFSEIGLLISSPALILEKGRQHIHASIKITPDSYNESKALFDGLLYREIEQQNITSTDKEKLRTKVVSKFISDAFVIYITDYDGWKQAEHCSIKINSENHSLNIDLFLDEQKGKLISFDNEIHSGDINTEWPCIKLILNNDAQYHPYKILKNMVIDEIEIKATVLDASNLILSNSTGNIDSSIPFTPFGPVPVLGSYLRIQNPLILQKNLAYLEININWLGLPQERSGFARYYNAYPSSVENSDFKALVTQNKSSARDKGNQNQQQIELFESEGEYLSNAKKILVKLENIKYNNKASFSGEKTDLNVNSLYLILTSPFGAFGHQIFSEIYAEAALKKSRFKKASIALPGQPYTPLIDRLTVNYSNSAKEIMLRKQENNTSDIKLFHIHPFGHVQVFPGPVKSQSFLLPQINHKGNLFIGLRKINEGEIVSIGFELIPAVYINTVINSPKVYWEYLLNDEWEPLEDLLLEDNTLGLIQTGVVKIRIPNIIQLNNSRFPKGKFWIRAFYDGKEDLNSRIKNIFTQAVSIISSDETDESLLSLNNNVVKISFPGKAGIGNISGPFALKLNETVENDNSFYCRISEQLRHKNRAVTNWDIERIILARFNQIDKVRVYGKNSHPKEIVKGSNIQIVVIPRNNLVNGTRKHSSRVDFSTLMEIKQYISQFVSPYANVEVSNPVYEQLKVRCCVKFIDIQKGGYYKNVLNNELISYLSPDIESQFIEKGFDESISKTEILNFIESRPYVDFITEFSVLQLVEVNRRYKIIDTAKIQKINELRTVSPYAILTSAPEHQIENVPEVKTLDPKISGIGDLSIETDFVISDSDGKYY